MTCTEHNDELRSLWEGRNSLSNSAWARLRELIHSCLQSSGTIRRKFASLPGDESLSDYIDHFIVDRVFMPMTREGKQTAKLKHANVLIKFFRNYLEDVRKRNKRYVDLGSSNPRSTAAVNPVDMAYPTTESEEVASLNRSEINVGPLALLGLSRNIVADAAKKWLLVQEEWVRIYLAFNHCPEEWESIPLSKLRALYQIPSYHSKARKLGITSKKGGFEAYDEFEKTLLGRWIASLPIEIETENYDAMSAALEILCVEALSVCRGDPKADA